MMEEVVVVVQRCMIADKDHHCQKVVVVVVAMFEMAIVVADNLQSHCYSRNNCSSLDHIDTHSTGSIDCNHIQHMSLVHWLLKLH